MHLTKFLSPLFICLLFIFSSCDKEDDPGAPGNCLPARIISDGDGLTDADITYDSQGRISYSDITTDEISGKGPVEYTNGLPTKLTLNSFLGKGYISYDYNPQGQLIALTYYTDFFSDKALPLKGTEFEYTGGRASKAIDYFYLSFSNPTSEKEFTQYTLFEYDTRGNILKRSIYTGESPANATLKNTIEYTYDNTTNPGAGIGKLIYGISTPNNELSAVFKYSTGEEYPESSYSTSYKVDGNGNIIEITETTKTGRISKTNIQYTCQ